jgi:4-amino-4-deoxy-L-arabinose transferase-like glycosyltransferase
MRSKPRDLQLLMLAAAMTLLVRTAFFLISAPNYGIENIKKDGCLQIAQSLVNGGGYSLEGPGVPTARRGPVVVYFFAAVLWLFGQHGLPIIIAQWICDVGTCVVLYLLALEVFNDKRVAFISSLLFAFYLPEIGFTLLAWSEPLFSLLLIAFTLSFIRALQSPAPWRFAVTGALLALTILARPLMQFYPLIVVALIFGNLRKNWREAVKCAGTLSITLLFVLAPWTIRNYRIFGHFIPGNTHSGLSFFQANYALSEPDFLRHRDVDEGNEALMKDLEERIGPASRPGVFRHAVNKGFSEYEVDQMARAAAFEAILAHPERYFVLSLVRFFRLWFNVGYGAPPSLQSYMVLAVNAILLGLAVIPFLRYRGPWLNRAIPVVTLVGFNTALHMAIEAVFRYSVPVFPYVFLFAAFTLFKITAFERVICYFPMIRSGRATRV